MEYSLTSLFSILFFPQWALLVGNCWGYTVDLVLRKKDEKMCSKAMPDTSEPFYCLDLECRVFFIQQKYPLLVFVAFIGYLLFLESQSIFFSWKKRIKNNHVCNRQDSCKQISLVFCTELHTVYIHSYIQKYAYKYENICVFMCVQHAYIYKQLSIYLSLTHLTEVENKT